MKEKMRLFFGLGTESERPALYRWQRRLALSGKPVDPDNFHITLVFLGMVDKALLPALCARAGTIRVPAFNLCLDQPGWFAKPRVAWLAPSQYPPELLQLVETLTILAENLELPTERRRYHAHVTLYRKVPPVPDMALAGHAVTLQVNTFTLYESCSTPQGVRYVPLASWPLQPPTAGTTQEPSQ